MGWGGGLKIPTQWKWDIQVLIRSYNAKNQFEHPDWTGLHGIPHYTLLDHFLKIIDGILRPEGATVGCGRRPQHHWSHRIPYSRPEAAMIACGRRPQGSWCHRCVSYFLNSPLYFFGRVPEIIDGILRPEGATVGCGRRPQHHWSHRIPYSRPEAAMIACGQRPQGSWCHRCVSYFLNSSLPFLDLLLKS